MRNKLFVLLFLLTVFLFSGTVSAQVAVERSSEIVKVGGKEYYMHHVQSGQTLYSIAHAYQVSVEEIEKLNPELKDGLKAGYVIGIPLHTDTPSRAVDPESVGTTSDKPAEPSGAGKPNMTEGVLGGKYQVKAGEDLYAIAKKFGIDVAEFKAINPGLTNEPKAGMVIDVPNIVNTDDYIVHKVEYNERTSSLLKRWKVSENEFREKNISVGSHVFVNQVVLIPIDRVDSQLVRPEAELESEVEGETPDPEEIVIIDDEPEMVPECDVHPENARQRYHVVLMAPLYLGNLGSLDFTKETVSKAQKSRSLLFLQYYEGFMLAVEKMTENQGLKLDLTVIDVTESVATAENAVRQIEGKDIDMIIGPFFGKSFTVVEDYAKAKGIVTVNPLSTRESIIEGSPNVVKVKPSKSGQILELTNLVKIHYRDSNVFIVSKENSDDSLFLNTLERQLNAVVNEEVTISGDEIMQYARSESQRKEMGEKMVSTVTIEGQVYSTADLHDVVLANTVKRHTLSSGDLSGLKSELSGVRNNLIIAYGDDNVFATQMLNTLKKSADKNPITLVGIPDWTKHEKLLVENLLGMNAIYFTDNFVDYRDEQVKNFVQRFRRKYKTEPQEYAFEGYDLGCYFLTALMRYGSDMLDCLPYFEMPLLHTRFHFMDRGIHHGVENQSWSVYQYDKESIELHPIDPFNTATHE